MPFPIGCFPDRPPRVRHRPPGLRPPCPPPRLGHQPVRLLPAAPLRRAAVIRLQVPLAPLRRGLGTLRRPMSKASQTLQVCSFIARFFKLEKNSKSCNFCLFFSSSLSSVRSQASASLYLLMRQNFEIGNVGFFLEERSKMLIGIFTAVVVVLRTHNGFRNKETTHPYCPFRFNGLSDEHFCDHLRLPLKEGRKKK